MKIEYESILNELNLLSDEKYKIFNSKIVPTKQSMLGVRIPILRKIAKQIINEDAIKFIELDKQDVYEMVLLEGIVLSYIDKTFKDLVPLIENYLGKVDNWAHVDTPMLSFKSISNDKFFVYKIVNKWIKSDKEYVVRTALVILLKFFVQKEYLEDIFKLSQEVKHDGYYVHMANAWLLSVCMVKYPNETIAFFKLNNLDKRTHNKAIQKSIESFRVSKSDKLIIKNLKV